MKPNLCFLSALALVVTACATIPDETNAGLDKPIDCSTADEDVAALTSAIPGRRERRRVVLKSLTPVGAATGIITRDYRDRARVATGQLERDLNNKIADIYEQCGQGT
ncbi:MAG: hypothetical protein AAFX54_10985 [Pseudomonadota bacterium]